MEKADATTAFLQGRASETGRLVFARPVPELAAELGVDNGTAVQILKACYGLANAPREWYNSCDETFRRLGFERCRTEPCCWIYRVGGRDAAAQGEVRPPREGEDVETLPGTLEHKEVLGMICGHVDDFLICGPPDHPEWQRLRAELQKAFVWSDWERYTFYHCGVKIEQHLDYSFTLSQPDYAEKVDLIDVSPARRAQTGERLTPAEESQLRAVVGAVQWRAVRTGPQFCAATSLLQSSISTGTMQDLITANKLVKHKAARQQTLRIHAFSPESQLEFFSFTDAALANRPDKRSTLGRALGIAPASMGQGREEDVSLVSWHSGKCPRVAKSSLAAEVQAMTEGESELMWCRLQWAEMTGLTFEITGRL